jgi:hypothetical protein
MPSINLLDSSGTADQRMCRSFELIDPDNVAAGGLKPQLSLSIFRPGLRGIHQIGTMDAYSLTTKNERERCLGNGNGDDLSKFCPTM